MSHLPVSQHMAGDSQWMSSNDRKQVGARTPKGKEGEAWVRCWPEASEQPRGKVPSSHVFAAGGAHPWFRKFGETESYQAWLKPALDLSLSTQRPRG